MHPAFSIIFFTSATGAGYGLLTLLGLFGAFGILPPDRWLGLISLALALGLIISGLLSSTLHLGHPERAWRALSQWRSSWLSREGVASLVTFVPASVFGIGWVFFEKTNGFVAVAGLAAAAGAMATVVATGMIYASLKPVAQWNSPYTLPAYLIFAVMTGAVLLSAILHLWGSPLRESDGLALVTIAVGWGWKLATWHYNDKIQPNVTVNSATGLIRGQVRSVEWPHTEENYVLKEMGYQIARKHAAKLRGFVELCAFALPLLAMGIALPGNGKIATMAAAIAFFAQLPGILAERWLFFAEAKHVVTLYYRP